MDLKINGWGFGFLFVIAWAVPWMAYRSKRILTGGELPLPKPVFFWQSTLMQFLLYAFALVVAATNRISLRLLPLHLLKGWATAAALLAVAVLALRIMWRWRGKADRRLLRSILPHEGGDLLPFLALCSVAAVSEEVVYRGVGYRLLLRLGLTLWIAVLLLAIVFALAHSIQGWRSVAAIAVFAAGFHAVVILGGGLIPAIVAHFAYDAFAGIAIPRWIQREESRS